MNFIILGAGAVGCYVGGRLAAAGQQIALVGRPRTLEPIALAGLTVSDLDGFNAHLTPQQLLPATSLATAWSQTKSKKWVGLTVILLCVKSGATVAAAAEIAACCPAGTVVISLQNGVDNAARLAQAAPHLQVVAGMVPFNVVMSTPGQVHRATTGSLYLGRCEITRQIAPIWSAAGLPTELADDMRAVLWGKLLLNLNNPINALSGLPLREQLLDADYRHVLAALQKEALGVMARAGIKPAQVATVPPWLLPHVLNLPTWLFKRVAARMLRMDASARSSMWDDVQQGRTTEINDLCGAVVRLAELTNTQAPHNAAMCELIAGHKKDQHRSGHELRKALYYL